MNKDKIQLLKKDISGYIGNVLYSENKLSNEELKEELKCVCEYVMALCDLICNDKIKSDYLGISKTINLK